MRSISSSPAPDRSVVESVHSERGSHRDRDAAVEGAGEREPRRVSTRIRLAAAAAIRAGLGLSVVGGVGSGTGGGRWLLSLAAPGQGQDARRTWLPFP